MNKSAKEMFEELGYKNTKKEDKIILFENFSFDISIEFLNEDGDKSIVLQKLGIDDGGDFIILSLEELKAINKQIEELGWLDE